jgi:hypothetical protein
MSNEEAINIEVKLNKKMFWGFGSIIVTLIISCATFVYGTKGDIKELFSKHEDHKAEIVDIKIELQKKASSQDMLNIQNDVREIRGSNQKILEILLEKQK